MKTKCQFMSICAIICLFLAGCAGVWHAARDDGMLHFNLGRTAARLVLGNNPDYIPEAQQGIKDGIALVSGNNIDPVRAARGIVDFVDKLILEGGQDQYIDIVRQILDMLQDVFKVDMQVPEQAQRAADIVANFLTGAQAGLEDVRVN